MASEHKKAIGSDVVVRALVRHRADPTRLLQILREVQDELDWIAPETEREVAAGLAVPITRVQSVVQFYSFLYDRPRGRYRVLFSDNITDRMLGNAALIEHMLKRLKLRRGQVSADGAVSVDLTSCTGMCDQGPAMLVNNQAVTRLTPRRIDEICELIQIGAPLGEWPSAVLPRRRQHPSSPDPADAAGARRRARRRHRPRTAGRDGRDETIEPARPRRRGFPDRHQAGRRPQRAGRAALHRLQRRRGRAGNLQGPGSAELLLGPRPRGHGDRRLPRRRDQGLHLSARRVQAPAGAVAARHRYDARQRTARHVDSRRARFRFRHRDPHGGWRLHLRRGHGPGRIARRQARTSSRASSFHGVGRLPRQADGGRQCRDPRPLHRDRHRGRRRRSPSAAPRRRPARSSSPYRATATVRASTNISSA